MEMRNMTWSISIRNSMIDMRTMKEYFHVFAICLLAVAGCAKELTVIQEEPMIHEQEETLVEYPTISATFENKDTRTRLELEENGAKVLWSKGDEIMVAYEMSDLDYDYLLLFSTEDDGVSTASFTASACEPPGEVTHCLAIHPSTYRINSSQVSIYVPTKQQAVSGGIEEGLNVAYATASSFEENLVFKNALSMLQFKLSGDVSKLSSIKFIANSTIAGEGLLENLDNDEPTYNMNYHFNPILENPSNSIELQGPFEENTDYLIATIPCTTKGFSMVFIDEDGSFHVRQSSKEMTLKRSRITNIGTVNIPASQDIFVYKYNEQTLGNNPVDIVILPEGFTISERKEYETRAETAMDYIFNVEPYASLKEYINVYVMWTPSTDSGASITDGNGNITTSRNTAFGCRWGSDSYSDMIADEDKIYGYVSAHCPEIVRGELTIDEVPILLIVNDDRYGGRAISTATGRTYCMAPYARGGAALTWPYSSSGMIASSNDPADGLEAREVTDTELQQLGRNSGDWKNIVLHEFGGHSIGRLSDEYWGTSYYTTQTSFYVHTWPVPYGLNVSGYYDDVPWQELLDIKDELCNQDSRYERVGRFQGANNYIFNFWRSEEISCMIDNRPYFSTWQRVLIAKLILERAGEVFNLGSFLESNDPTDPIRDNVASSISAPKENRGPVYMMPPLAPPLLIDNSVSLEQ